MEPRIQYAKTSDGVSIAYAEAGAGRTLMHMQAFGFSHAELNWQYRAALLHPLAEAYHLVYHDARGTGLSDRAAIDFSIDAMMRDIEGVVAEIGEEVFVLSALGNSTPLAVRYAATHPERISHLILSDGWAEFSDVASSPAYGALAPLLDADWTLFTETFGQVLWGYEDPENGRLLAEFLRSCCSQEAMRALLKSVRSFDARDYLPRVSCPTLVVNHKDSRLFPAEAGQRLAGAIPKARLVLVEHDMTWAALPQLIFDFVGGATTPTRRARTDEGSIVHTILFTDIENSTALTQRLGDAKAQELLRAHNTIVRDALNSCGGAEIKHTGDGIMASFPSASRAIECAVAIQRAVAAGGDSLLRVRLGLNAGEPVAEERDLFGTAVQLARRICDQADGGAVLVSNVVRELAMGKGFLFNDTGEVALKGFEDPVRLYEVRWREEA